MTHPEELLADYAEGMLAEGERAVVDAHLSTCAACREEVELARTAISALSTLEERPVPLGVTGPVLAEGGRRFERRRAVVWERLQWGAGIAAAAALVLVVALNVGADNGVTLRGANDATAPAAEATAEQRIEVIEKQDRTYSEGDVRDLAQNAARLSDRNEEEVGPVAGGSVDMATSPEATTSPTGTEIAATFVDAGPGLRCLTGAEVPVDDPRDRLVQLFEARFGRSPAYFAVFLEGPGADQPADTVVVWVVARRDCRILHFTFQPIE